MKQAGKPDIGCSGVRSYIGGVDAETQLLEGIDPGIREAVHRLREAGVETFESCQGGDGHAYPEPTVRFHGERSEGFRALSVAILHALPVGDLRRVWPLVDGEPTGPYWELTFRA